MATIAMVVTTIEFYHTITLILYIATFTMVVRTKIMMAISHAIVIFVLAISARASLMIFAARTLHLLLAHFHLFFTTVAVVGRTAAATASAAGKRRVSKEH